MEPTASPMPHARALSDLGITIAVPRHLYFYFNFLPFFSRHGLTGNELINSLTQEHGFFKKKER